ncbi:MAG: hypothetical protein ACRD0J_05455 [Acidimicrobiales bacterium]
MRPRRPRCCAPLAAWPCYGTHSRFPADLGEAFAAVYRRVLPDSPLFRGISAGVAAYSGQLDKAADGIRQVGGFAEPEQWRLDWERPYTPGPSG